MKLDSTKNWRKKTAAPKVPSWSVLPDFPQAPIGIFVPHLIGTARHLGPWKVLLEVGPKIYISDKKPFHGTKEIQYFMIQMPHPVE